MESKTMDEAEMNDEEMNNAAIKELKEILSEDQEISNNYQEVRRYYADPHDALNKIKDAIREAGGIQSICSHENYDVYPPSIRYEEVFPTTKYGDHDAVKQLIKDIKARMQNFKYIDKFFNSIFKKLWEKDPVLKEVTWSGVDICRIFSIRYTRIVENHIRQYGYTECLHFNERI